jgi:hypothetical protein
MGFILLLRVEYDCQISFNRPFHAGQFRHRSSLPGVAGPKLAHHMAQRQAAAFPSNGYSANFALAAIGNKFRQKITGFKSREVFVVHLEGHGRNALLAGG